MSFGYAIGDVITVAQLAWNTVQNARKACGEHDELTREVLSLHVVLRRLEQEVKKPENSINDFETGDMHGKELRVIFDGCKKVLNILDQVLTKYNALSEQERSGRKLWQQIRFGNGKMTNLAEMRAKLTYYTSAMSLFLNMVSVGAMGRVERQMNDAGGDLKEIKVAVNSITAHLMSKSNRHEGSILTAYADDDRAVWKEFRRELLEDGFSSSVIRKHKCLIKAYIEELGSRGLLDEEDPNEEEGDSQHCDDESGIEGATAHYPKIPNEFDAPPRPKAEDELPVRSEPPLVFNAKPRAAAHSKVGLGHKEGPTQDTVSGIGSQPEPKTNLPWIWSHEKNGKNQQSPAEEIRASEVEHRHSTTAIDGDWDRSNDAGEKPRDECVPAGEDDGTDNVAKEISDSRPRHSRVAFPRDSMAPPPRPSSAKISTKSGKQDEETTRLFHDTWHQVHDDLAPDFIEWSSLAYNNVPWNPKNPPWKWVSLYQINASKLLTLMTLMPPADLIVRQQELISDLQSIQKAIKWHFALIRHAESPQHIFEDRRSEGKGYRIIFDVSWLRGVVVSTGARCSLCSP